jgi:hypothetical protein
VAPAILYRGACYFLPWRLLFCTVTPAILYRGACYFEHNYCSFFPSPAKNMYQFTCNQHKAPDNSEVYKALQNLVRQYTKGFVSPSGAQTVEGAAGFGKLVYPDLTF